MSKLKRFVILALIAVGIFFVTRTAEAQLPQFRVVCALDRDDALRELDKQFGEAIEFRAIITNGTMLEIAINNKTQTWTLLLTNPNDPHHAICLYFAGNQWHKPDLIKPPKGTLH